MQYRCIAGRLLTINTYEFSSGKHFQCLWHMNCSGIFHGHTNLVFCLLCNIWWSLWSPASYRRGKLSQSPHSTMIVCYQSHSYFMQIRTLGMLRSRFQALPSAFNHCLIPPPTRNDKNRKRFFNQRFQKVQAFQPYNMWLSCLKESFVRLLIHS